MKLNKKNCTSIENPDYLIRNPYYMCRNDSGEFMARKDVKGEQYRKQRPGKTIKTNAKYGMSKDSPFLTRFSESHDMTESVFQEKNLKKKDYSATSLMPTSIVDTGTYKGIFMKLLNRSQSKEKQNMMQAYSNK